MFSDFEVLRQCFLAQFVCSVPRGLGNLIISLSGDRLWLFQDKENAYGFTLKLAREKFLVAVRKFETKDNLDLEMMPVFGSSVTHRM